MRPARDGSSARRGDKPRGTAPRWMAGRALKEHGSRELQAEFSPAKNRLGKLA
jgi:hypothetical protein